MGLVAVGGTWVASPPAPLANPDRSSISESAALGFAKRSVLEVGEGTVKETVDRVKGKVVI